jgi:hypothetical protein
MNDFIYKLLEVALDCGIFEERFWLMTIAEVNRAIESKNRADKAAAKQEALFNYIQAELIGRSVGRFIVNGEVAMPPVEEVYSSLFTEENIDKEEEKISKAAELSAARFIQFANFHNSKINKEVLKTE